MLFGCLCYSFFCSLLEERKTFAMSCQASFKLFFSNDRKNTSKDSLCNQSMVLGILDSNIIVEYCDNIIRCMICHYNIHIRLWALGLGGPANWSICILCKQFVAEIICEFFVTLQYLYIFDTWCSLSLHIWTENLTSIVIQYPCATSSPPFLLQSMDFKSCSWEDADKPYHT